MEQCEKGLWKAVSVKKCVVSVYLDPEEYATLAELTSTTKEAKSAALRRVLLVMLSAWRRAQRRVAVLAVPDPDLEKLKKIEEQMPGTAMMIVDRKVE